MLMSLGLWGAKARLFYYPFDDNGMDIPVGLTRISRHGDQDGRVEKSHNDQEELSFVMTLPCGLLPICMTPRRLFERLLSRSCRQKLSLFCFPSIFARYPPLLRHDSSPFTCRFSLLALC